MTPEALSAFMAARARQEKRRARGELDAREMPAACGGDVTHAAMRADREEFLARAFNIRPWPGAGLVLGTCTCGSDVAIEAVVYAGAQPFSQPTGGTP
ncbi:MAG TPA: hypothetical protein VFL90_06330 [Methylomirabilota bacterium]|nr:hypothetical protein [Methylomirabilota bacterium]